jgi:hypothetical protein
MVPERICHCLLCRVELQLTADMKSANGAYEALFSSAGNGLCAFASPGLLLSRLKSSGSGPHSDELFRDLIGLRPRNAEFVEKLFVLAFLPMLHRTVRNVTKQQTGISSDDAAQQALSLFLEILASKELEARRSHFGFAISRAVKRRMFEWANREGTSMGAVDASLDCPVTEPSVERHALLRHFLDRAVAKGFVREADLNLLIEFKLNGNIGEHSPANTSNAFRQRMKRLLAKLRRLARRRTMPKARHV